MSRKILKRQANRIFCTKDDIESVTALEYLADYPLILMVAIINSAQITTITRRRKKI